MKKLLLFAVLISASFSCQDKKKNIKEKTAKTARVNNPERAEQLFEEFKSLYYELLEFKDKSDFKEWGFAIAGPYNKWLKKVDELISDPDSKLLLENGVFAGELGMLGLEYKSSKGKETKSTKYFNKYFQRQSA